MAYSACGPTNEFERHYGDAAKKLLIWIGLSFSPLRGGLPLHTRDRPLHGTRYEQAP